MAVDEDRKKICDLGIIVPMSSLHCVNLYQHQVSIKMNGIRFKVTSGHMNIHICSIYYCIYVHFVQLTQFLELFVVWLEVLIGI